MLLERLVFAQKKLKRMCNIRNDLHLARHLAPTTGLSALHYHTSAFRNHFNEIDSK